MRLAGSSRQIGAQAATFATTQALNYALPGSGTVAAPFAGQLFGRLFGRKSPHTELNEHGLVENSKAFWEARGTSADLLGLLSPNPLGIPYLLADWDVLGSAKRLQKRYIAESQGRGLDEAMQRAALFLQDPALTGAFNEAQLAVFTPLAGMLRPGTARTSGGVGYARLRL